MTTSRPEPPVTVPASLDTDAKMSLVPSPAGTAQFSRFTFGYSGYTALPSNDGSPGTYIAPVFSTGLRAVIYLSPSGV